MKITTQGDVLQEKLSTAARFTSSLPGLSETLRGVLLKGDREGLHIYATNLSSYYHAVLPLNMGEDVRAVIDTKKIIEFLSLLGGGALDIEIEKNALRIRKGETTGVFPLISRDDFPLPPEIKSEGQEIDTEFFLQTLPLVLFSASKDEARPALNGVNFIDMDTELGIVSTDGFRLSLLKAKKERAIFPMLIPSGFLYEVIKHMKGENSFSLSFSPEERLVLFKIGGDLFYTRLVDGEFPPFEKVIPAEKKTTARVDRQEFITKLKLISVFARDASNIVVCCFSKQGLVIRPKTEGGGENLSQLETVHEGEDQEVAFNLRFILDFLNATQEKKIEIEILRPDAPVVFRIKGRKDFIHIIMPVRMQE